ncbi:hypothetical protein BOX15_Mlig017674g1 [Macrostomum lignano]|uniref:Uncharacterized protein n=1 Tax=Macrostomum lignano TaxID=282301 RepID=A0A267GT04_9PLAT|nr:hypothetical protein BOX15_Mlig017674g1 [Macrostomum lignano]
MHPRLRLHQLLNISNSIVYQSSTRQPAKSTISNRLVELLESARSVPRHSAAITVSPESLTPSKISDHKGAMLFVVAVVTVYAMAIFFMILSHVGHRAAKHDLDREIVAYLRQAPIIKLEEELAERRRTCMLVAMQSSFELRSLALPERSREGELPDSSV